MIQKIWHHFRRGELRGMLFDKFFRMWIPRAVGKTSFFFYRSLYKGFSFGTGICCWGRIAISKSPGSRIRFGNRLHIVSDYERASIAIYGRCKFQVFFNGCIDIGDDVGLNGTSITCRTTSITIGKGTIIAPNVIIVDSDFHATWPPENRTLSMGYNQDRPVSIGHNVWISMNTTILKGVTIGDGSIIAAGSVVVDSIPAGVIAGGVPAKVIKHLQ